MWWSFNTRNTEGHSYREVTVLISTEAIGARLRTLKSGVCRSVFNARPQEVLASSLAYEVGVSGKGLRAGVVYTMGIL